MKKMKRFLMLLSIILGLFITSTFINRDKSVEKSNGNIVLLTYHLIIEESTDEEPWQFYRKFEDFKNDMKILKESGINISSYQEVVDQLNSGLEINEPTVIVQFDDGYASDYELAFPILKELDLKATFFISTGRISENMTGFASWDNIKEMYHYKNKEGKRLFEFGAHGHEHSSLGQNEEETKEEWLDRVYIELSEPQKEIYYHLGFKPTLLALPYGKGFNNQELRKMASELNYELVRGWKVDNDHFISSNPSNIKFFDVYNNSDINEAVKLALNLYGDK